MTRMRPIEEQIIAITGASSGIGRCTARLAAAAGATVVLIARNRDALEEAANDIHAAGGAAHTITADLSIPEEAEAAAARIARDFGRIDTWVNNAGVALYGRLMDLGLDDMRRQFDVVYWGTVYGSRAAVPRLALEGGVLINVASAVADRALPLQGTYSAAKHAVKAFTDALRMELVDAGVPIAVCLVKPSSVDTPFFAKAKTLEDVEPQPFPPVYAPELVARAIVACAERPRREITVGGSGRVLGWAQKVSPALTDRYLERASFERQRTERPVARGREDNLYEPAAEDGGERGDGRNWDGRVLRRSVATWASLHPGQAAFAALLAGAGALAGVKLLGKDGALRPRRGRRIRVSSVRWRTGK